MVIPSTSVSREHARVEKTDEGIFISDLGSSNGTQVNGTPVVRGKEFLEARPGIVLRSGRDTHDTELG